MENVVRTLYSLQYCKQPIDGVKQRVFEQKLLLLLMGVKL